MKAASDMDNEWFFFDGAFNASANIEASVNTWQHENFIVLYMEKTG